MEQAVDPSSLISYLRRTGDDVEAAMHEDLADALQDTDPLLAEVVHYSLFNGGKRIRPQLAILAAGLCGITGGSVYRLASAFEYLHVATLIHDDVIDNARERRGQPSVGSKYGATAAILAGDWLHARSMHLVGRLAGPEGLEIFCRSTEAMVDGEFLQLRHVNDLAISEEQYFAVIRCKTALLISSTCEIGAVHAGASPKRRHALASYGAGLGTAFQVVDDLLDYLGDASSTGKKTGNDYFEGKVTLPLIKAMTEAGREERERMAELFSPASRNHSRLKELTGLMERNNGFVLARKEAEALAGKAVAALDVFRGGGRDELLSLLRALAVYVLKRDR